MGRKPTINANLPKHMRKRVKPSGKTYYYLDTGGKPRKEIPLGDDYILALKKYSEMNIAATMVAVTMGDVLRRYITEELPKLATNTIRIQLSDVKHLQKYFSDAPLDQVKPVHINKFLDKNRDKPTTANRCKRLFSTVWNHARKWGYTDLPNPCTGIQGHKLQKRTIYITDEVFSLVRQHASEPLRDALDLAYLTGQRPADTLSMTAHDIVDGHLIVTQAKTLQPLRIIIQGKLLDLIDRIEKRKTTHKICTAALLVNMQGKRLTKAVLRKHFDAAKKSAAEASPDMAQAVKEFWFYDLRAKAADDTADDRGEQAASHLLGHDSVKTTQRHYLRRGKKVEPTR